MHAVYHFAEGDAVFLKHPCWAYTLRAQTPKIEMFVGNVFVAKI